MAYRPRLYHIQNEKELWKYFVENAGYLQNEQIYRVAGIYSNDTATLYKKLIEAWKSDIENRKDEIVNDVVRVLSS